MKTETLKKQLEDTSKTPYVFAYFLHKTTVADTLDHYDSEIIPTEEQVNECLAYVNEKIEEGSEYITGSSSIGDLVDKYILEYFEIDY